MMFINDVLNFVNDNISIIPATFRMAIPLVFAALGGVVSERAGVVNIALEGLMLMGAFFAMIGSYFFDSPLFGIFLALASGFSGAFIHSVVSIKFKADQIVSGVAVNILAVGLTNYIMVLLFKKAGTSPSVPHISWQFFGIIALLLVATIHLILYYTPIGLRIRAVGEHPKAADTLGIDVLRLRFWCVIVSGLLAALGGAYLSIGHLSSYTREMSAGKGFIALAAVIFGKWNPVGTAFACLLFGFTDALQLRLMGKGVIPPEFLNMLPYVITMIVLAGVIGKARAPAADGVPYDPLDKR